VGDAKVKMSGDKERLVPPETNEQQFLEKTLSGFRIVPGKPPAPGKTQSIEVTKLLNDIDTTENPYAWKKIPAFSAQSATDAIRRNTINTASPVPVPINATNFYNLSASPLTKTLS
jgi:hypothetical protein